MADSERAGFGRDEDVARDSVERGSYDQKASDPWVQVLFLGSSLISTVLNAPRAKEGMSSMMTHVYLLRAAMAGPVLQKFVAQQIMGFQWLGKACESHTAQGPRESPAQLDDPSPARAARPCPRGRGRCGR